MMKEFTTVFRLLVDTGCFLIWLRKDLLGRTVLSYHHRGDKQIEEMCRGKDKYGVSLDD